MCYLKTAGGWYRKHAAVDVELEKLEKEAGAAKKGLWADPQPVPLWRCRKKQRPIQ